MLREYRRQVPLRRPCGKCPGRLPRCALKAADSALPSYTSLTPLTSPERILACMMAAGTPRIHHGGILYASSTELHS